MRPVRKRERDRLPFAQHTAPMGGALGSYDLHDCTPVFEALPDTWRVLTHHGEIVGNRQYLPLAPAAREAMRAGRLTESQMRLDHLVSLDLPGEVSVNVAALVVAPAYRKRRGLVMLLRSLVEKLSELARRGVQVATISANAWTPEAVLLCDRLGMRSVGRITSDPGIFFEMKPLKLLDPPGSPAVDPFFDFLSSQPPEVRGMTCP